MLNPYRTRPKDPLARSTDHARIRTATLAFGFICVLFGVVLSGAERARCALLATLGGTVLLATRPRTL